MARFVTVLPLYCTGTAVTYTCLSLVEHMRPFGAQPEVWVPTAVGAGRRPWVRETVPSSLRSVAYRLVNEAAILRVMEQRALAGLDEGDWVYTYPGVSLGFLETATKRGIRIVAERINCAEATCDRVVRAETERLGWEPDAILDGEVLRLKRERAELSLCDHVFAPNPLVRKSLEEINVHPKRIIDTSYGFDPGRLTGTSRAGPEFDGLTLAFVGLSCIRKGVHLLFDALQRTSVPIRLLLAGGVSKTIEKECAAMLSKPNIVRLGYVSDVGAVYRSADVFVFPSLEEGGPMVTYEAMSLGVPVVVSPMGAGAIARDGLDGFVIPPHDVDAMAAAFDRLWREPELRRAMGESSRERAKDFTWEKVAKRRQASLEALASFPRVPLLPGT